VLKPVVDAINTEFQKQAAEAKIDLTAQAEALNARLGMFLDKLRSSPFRVGTSLTAAADEKGSFRLDFYKAGNEWVLSFGDIDSDGDERSRSVLQISIADKARALKYLPQLVEKMKANHAATLNQLRTAHSSLDAALDLLAKFEKEGA
jgi:hypothetical protein